MKLKPFVAAITAMFGGRKAGRFVGRARVTDVSYPYQSFTYRMPAGFPGDVNRTHPASIEPSVNDTTNPIQAAGYPSVANPAANTVRALISTDTSITNLYGIAVRSFPIQQTNTTAPYGAIGFAGLSALGSGQAVDVMRSGYMLVTLNTGTGTKGGPVFVWVAATSGVHTQGGFETTASAGNTCALDPGKYFFNGPADANGVVEIAANV